MDSAPTPARTVLLRHTLPEGLAHLDWLIERPGAPEALLIAFRVQERPDGPEITAFVAQRAADHRRVYLDFEGPVSGGRGDVRRVAVGIVESLSEDAGAITIRVRFAGDQSAWRGIKGPDDSWRFQRLPI